jgi:CheY-like chemotaxis protein
MLDYKLPDMTGLDVLRSVRAEPTRSVVIMMTAFSTIEAPSRRSSWARSTTSPSPSTWTS